MENTPKVATREFIAADILRNYDQATRIDAPISVDGLLIRTRAFLSMNHYEPWSDSDITSIVAEVLPALTVKPEPSREQLEAAKKYIEMETELGMDHPSLGAFWEAMGAKFGLETWTVAVNYSLRHPAKKPSPPSPLEEEPSDGMPELLPVKALPGYLVDAWGVPHRVKSAGRKAGKVKPDNYLFRKKGEKAVRHMARYRLTVEGKQRAFYPRYLLRARIHAEQEWRSEVSPTHNEVSLP